MLSLNTLISYVGILFTKHTLFINSLNLIVFILYNSFPFLAVTVNSVNMTLAAVINRSQSYSFASC